MAVFHLFFCEIIVFSMDIMSIFFFFFFFLGGGGILCLLIRCPHLGKSEIRDRSLIRGATQWENHRSDTICTRLPDRVKPSHMDPPGRPHGISD